MTRASRGSRSGLAPAQVKGTDGWCGKNPKTRSKEYSPVLTFRQYRRMVRKEPEDTALAPVWVKGRNCLPQCALQNGARARADPRRAGGRLRDDTSATEPSRVAPAALAGGNAVCGRGRRARHRSAEGSLHSTGCTGSLSRGIRGTARSAALSGQAPEPRHPRYPHRHDHAAVHGIHRPDEGASARTRGRVPGDGGDAGGDQVPSSPASARQHR